MRQYLEKTRGRAAADVDACVHITRACRGNRGAFPTGRYVTYIRATVQYGTINIHSQHTNTYNAISNAWKLV